MKDLLVGKVVLICGGTEGLGTAIAREGAVGVITGRGDERGEKVVAELEAIGGTASFAHTDISDVAQA